jgi:hypothetical protein
MEEDNPYIGVINPDNSYRVGYNLTNYVEPNDINYYIDYSNQPNSEFLRSYFNNIEAPYTDNSRSLLGINLQRFLSDLNNIRGTRQAKDNALRTFRNDFINSATTGNRFSNNREQLFDELFNIDEYESISIGDGDIALNNYEEYQQSRKDAFGRIFDNIVKSTRRRIGDNSIINANIVRYNQLA